MFLKRQRAQSFVEFALIIPILIVVLLGVVEVTIFIGSYINLLDLTREAARFASNRDPFSSGMQGDTNCSTPADVNFFYDTACIFSPLQNSSTCTDPTFCNGFNSTLSLKSNEDDIKIYVFTESTINGAPRITDNALCNSSTTAGCPWVWSIHDGDPAHGNNSWYDCGRKTAAQVAIENALATPAPSFTKGVMEPYLKPQAINEKGFVVVEVFYCYHQVLNIPILSGFLPNPIVINTYTVMPLPAAQPTPTPIP